MKTRIIEFNKSVTTRRSVGRYIAATRLTGLTLDIGGRRGGVYSDCYEEGIVLDIVRNPQIDIQGDAHMLPFRTSALASILCTEVIEHMERPEKGLDEMRRVLKAGGRLVLTTRFLFPLHDRPGDFFRFTKFGLQRLLRKWEVEEILETDTSFETLGIVLNRLSMEKQVNIFLRAIILGITLIALPIARLFSRLVRTDAISTGYIVSARKRKDGNDW